MPTQPFANILKGAYPPLPPSKYAPGICSITVGTLNQPNSHQKHFANPPEIFFILSTKNSFLCPFERVNHWAYRKISYTYPKNYKKKFLMLSPEKLTFVSV